jgi:hypothetical protein
MRARGRLGRLPAPRASSVRRSVGPSARQSVLTRSSMGRRGVMDPRGTVTPHLMDGGRPERRTTGAPAASSGSSPFRRKGSSWDLPTSYAGSTRGAPHHRSMGPRGSWSLSRKLRPTASGSSSSGASSTPTPPPASRRFCWRLCAGGARRSSSISSRARPSTRPGSECCMTSRDCYAHRVEGRGWWRSRPRFRYRGSSG